MLNCVLNDLYEAFLKMWATSECAGEEPNVYSKSK